MKNHRFLFLFSIFYFLFSILASETNAAGATLFLAPSIGTYSVGSTFSVLIKVNTGGQAINIAEGALVFDPTKLEVISISKTGSIFTLWVQDPVFSNTDGTIAFAGGKSTPGYTGFSGTLITIIFKGLIAGTGNVNFSSGSVLADDGKGTNILASMISGSYNITTRKIETLPPAEEYVPPSTSGQVQAAPVISFLTHPEEDKWYSNNNPEFSWKLPPDITSVRLLYDKNPNSIPTITYEPAVSEKRLEDLADGVWYFHVRFKNKYGWGAIAHRKILIDTKPPKPFEITVDNQGDPTNPTPVLHFKTKDDLSGTEYYEVKIGDKLATAAAISVETNPYRPLPQPPGKHTVEVKAFDRAGNFALASAEFEILPIEAPKITKIPISIRIGETLEIEGEAVPEIMVRIYILKDGEKEPFLEKVKADLGGKFVLSYDRALAKGDYLVWAQSENEEGALSYSTKKYSLEVGLPPFLKFGKIAINYLTTMITLIILIVGAIAIIFYTWYRISLWRKRVRGETKEVSENVAKAFKALREEVEEQIEFLDGRPGLNKDERRVRDKLKEALDISEEFIKKEIKDVEKELE